MKAVLLFVSKTWVVYPHLGKALVRFHHRAVRLVTGMGTKHQREMTWVYPPIVEALVIAGLDEIGVYITRSHNTVVQYIVTCTIMELCLAEKRRPGMQL